MGKPTAARTAIDEGVALAAIGAVVRGVVELDDQARDEGARLAEDEVDAFGLDFVPVGLVAARPGLYFDKIGEANLGEEQHTCGYGGLERGKEIALSGGEQVRDAGVGRRCGRLHVSWRSGGRGYGCFPGSSARRRNRDAA